VLYKHRHLEKKLREHGAELQGPWQERFERWREALEAGSAPRVILGATHEATLEIVELKDLKRYAIDLA